MCTWLGDVVLRAASQLSRDMRDPGRLSPTVIWVVPGAGDYGARTKFLSWVPRMLRADEGAGQGAEGSSGGKGGLRSQGPGPGHRGQAHPCSSRSSGSPPWGTQSPLAQALSLGPRGTCERQGGQPVLPQGETAAERERQAWSHS